ncbi:hypothetical protein AGMMS50267_07360 [Spirochaetia bacterium]|nr:hypothetical protein AGMMS50267_07360 [Spirochaetia bacterium]
MGGGAPGPVKGTLTPAATTGVYELAVTVTAGGSVSVTVAKGGYAFSGSPQTVIVYYYNPSAPTAVFNSVIADGDAATATTTKLTLFFDQPITGLVSDDITLSGPTAVTKGALTSNGTAGVYELAVSGITASGTVTVTVINSNYNISGSPKDVEVVYNDPTAATVVLNSVTADGSTSALTTKLTLLFDQDITGLEASDITLIPGSTGAAKGALTSTGNPGEYELAVSGITESGTVTVRVTRTGYNVGGSPKDVDVFYFDPSAVPVANITLSIADQGGSLTLTGAAPFTVYKTGADGTATVTVTTTGYTYTWYVDGTSKGTGTSITINAGSISVGKHELVLAAADDATGITWTAAPIAFTVAAAH